MGCSFSCIKLPSSSKSSKLNHIRVVHLDGHIEHLNPPVTVAEVTGNPSKHFLFTHAHLISSCSTPLKSDTLLESGRVYFLLPHSLFDSNVSPVDLAPVTRKLASMARNKSKSGAVRCSPSSSPNLLSSDMISVRIRRENDQLVCGIKKPPKSSPWKPILATISERSLRWSASDLQDNAKVE